MAQRRMFSIRIANSARFLQMPSESQLLYFHMILRADDDGIVESYPLMKLLGVAPDSFKVLMAKGFIEQLNEDQVVVINDWPEHNKIRADRKINSIYLPLLISKKPDAKILIPEARSDVKDNSKRLNGQSTDGIGKVRLGKVNKKNTNTNVLVQKYELLKLTSKKENISLVKNRHSNNNYINNNYLTRIINKPAKKYSSLKDITEQDLQDITVSYKVSLGFVKLQFEKMKNWLEATGKTRKNYKATLKNFVLGELQRQIEKPKKGGVVDGTNI